MAKTYAMVVNSKNPMKHQQKSLLELVRERRILKMREPPDKQVGIPYVSLTEVFSHRSKF